LIYVINNFCILNAANLNELLKVTYPFANTCSDNSSSLPLSATADACRSARRALSLIATAQPATFLTCMAKEVSIMYKKRIIFLFVKYYIDIYL